MKSTALFLASLLASAVVAQPHRRHKARHNQLHKERDLEVVWVTETELFTEIVGVTTTVWVSPGFVAPAESTTSSEISITTTTAASAGQFYQGASEQSSSSTSSIYVAPAPVETPAPTSIYIAPVVETPTPSPSSVYVAPVPESSSAPAEVYTVAEVSTPEPAATPAPVETPAAVETPAPVYVAPVPTTSATPSSSGSGSGSSGGSCSGSSNACEGDITYYEAGLGACGVTNDGTTENVIALPVGLMGSQSNGNPYCGKTVTITYHGISIQAIVVDKCMGCEGMSIDLSHKAFQELDSDYMTIGRTKASWYFN